jgi:hypothetical protein
VEDVSIDVRNPISVKRPVLFVARYRLRATFGRRWRGYLTIVLLVGLVGGLAMGALAGARRTQSSFPSFLAGTDPSDLGGITAVLNPARGADVGYDPDLLARIAHLPEVKRLESYAGLNILPLAPDGAPADPASAAPGNGRGSIDGLNFDLDRVTVIQGRMADPERADEFVTDAMDAQLGGVHVGDLVPFGVYTNEQTSSPGFGTASVPAHLRIDARLVGIVVLNRTLVQDDVDAGFSLVNGLFTPALTRPLLGCCVNYTFTAVQVDRAQDAAAVQSSVNRILPRGLPAFQDMSPASAQAERAIKPEAVALGVFGGIAALAALVIGAQVISRQLLVSADERVVLRALGAGPTMTACDGLLGSLGAVVVGSLVAVGVAAGLSPLAPIGPVGRVFPGARLTFDWTVLGLGAVVLIVGLGAVGVALAYREGRQRAGRSEPGRSGPARDRRSKVAGAAAASGLPPSAVVGIRFALEPAADRAAVPTRSAVVGAILGMVVVVATLTFGSSLRQLVSHPALYGWKWDYELTAGGGGGDIPQQLAADALDQDPDVAAWSGVYFSTLPIDGQTIPVLGAGPDAAVQPPVLSGHGFAAPDQVVLGETTLAQLHKHVGDTVEVGGGDGAPAVLRVVGTATMPAVGTASLAHLEMGIGALLSDQLIPAEAKNTFANPVLGPNAILVRLRAGADGNRARDSLHRIAGLLSNRANFGVSVESVQRPAEIVNYRSMGGTPTLLGAGLAAGAVCALGLTLVASVRHRRRDLAVLKTLGLTRRQLAAVVAWQSTVAIVIGTVAGVPLGIALGRQLWVRFAQEVHAVPAPHVPAWSVVLVVVGALVLANIVAALPGRIAAATPAALVLRADR